MRRYSPEEKAGAVRMVRALRAELGTEHGTTARVASQLGYGVESVRSWVKQADIDDGLTVGVSTAEADRIKQLEQEIRELQRANEILKRARVFLRGGARPPAQEMTAFIDANRGDVIAGRRLGVERICKALQIPPSSYYATKSRPPSARSVSDSRLRPALRGLWEENYQVYGVRKLWKAARRSGIDVGRDQVARLMRAEQIAGVRRGKKVRTTRATAGADRHPDLVGRDFTATEPNQLWGHRPHPRPDLGGNGLRLLHHRRLLSDDRGLARRGEHAHPGSARRHRDGPLQSRHTVDRAALPQRCGQSIHLGPLRRTARRTRCNTVDRDRGRFLR